jgi:uncharacterized protein (TIGR00255 family)
MKSMTGYGLGSAGRGDQQVTVAIRAVNSRFLDLKVRGLDQDPVLEARVRDRVRETLHRGSVQVTVELPEDEKNSGITFNQKRFEEVEKILMFIQQEYGRHLEVGDLVSAGELFLTTAPSKPDARKVMQALDRALQQVDQMRRQEGGKIHTDLAERIATLKSLTEQLRIRAEQSAAERRDKYTSRIKELLNPVPVDETRLAQEIAILAERTDVSEEILRCESHFDQFLTFLEPDEPVGKQMNFLLQEITREVNTIGSKCADLDLVRIVIAMKGEVEKMREQVQNVL